MFRDDILRGPLFIGAFSLATLIWLQFAPFLHGYFLTADDVLFHYIAITSTPVEWLETAWKTAVWKAKLGELSAIPLAVLGNSGIESLVVRILNVGLFLSGLAMFAAYLGVLFGRSFGVLAGIFIVALSPLHFFHMTPTSYPLHLSPQIILGFGCLIALRHLPADEQHRIRRLAVCLLLFLALASSEYTMFFIGAAALFDAGIACAGSKTRLRTLSTDPRAWIVVLAFLTHILFQKTIGTGSYNAMSGQGQLLAIVKVQFWHSLNGVILGPAALESLSANVLPNTASEVLRAIGIGAATFICTLIALTRSQLRRSDLYLLIGLCLLVILCLTLPIALLQKYRDWCTSPRQCIYLDSRYAGWAVAVILGGVAAAMSHRRVARISWSAGLALFAVISALHNTHVSERMVEARAPWRIATDALCREARAWDSFLTSRTADQIPFHVTDTRTRQDYWIAWARVQDCGN